MAFLRVLGWIFIPYVMIFLRWNHLRAVGKTFGVIWAVFCALGVIGNLTRDKDTVKEASAPIVAEQKNDEKAQKDATEEKKEEVKKEEPKKEEPKKEEVKKWPDVQLSEETIKTALNDLKGLGYIKLDDKTLKAIEVRGDSETSKMINIRLDPGTVWDETDFAEKMANSIVYYGEILFKHPNIKEVTLWGYTSFTDQYGKSNEALAVKIGWDKETADKVDFNKFKDMALADYKRSFNIATQYYFHPAIYKNLKDSTGLKANKVKP
ncbi:hypothetical protein [Paenibacillus ehimensis]|uniref:Uncharacterized protein n=1 Tax=Paenibacillus ehimensis TaxID=79264 RepID=A0ABT8VI44_9BACL|nr:hypothetical protein [Paenibacillus ehimensis]MDO3680658.1 hypothetical protein [Paenibacillus ehimensis]